MRRQHPSRPVADGSWLAAMLTTPTCGQRCAKPVLDRRPEPALVSSSRVMGRFRSERRSVGPARAPWHPLEVRWNDKKSRRFQALRAAEARGPLTDAKCAELSRLLKDLDADEADALRP